MFEKLILHIRYPYTAGVIVTIWIGTAQLAVLARSESVTEMVLLNVIATTVIAALGFSSSR